MKTIAFIDTEIDYRSQKIGKDYKLQSDESNIPLNDSIKANDLNKYFIRHA